MDKPTCSIDGCEKQSQARTWCPMHYQRWRLFGSPLIAQQAAPRKKRPRRVGVDACSIDGCDGLLRARGWCVKHYKRWTTYGSPTARIPGEVVDGKRICPGCKIDKPVFEYSPTSTSGCRRCMANRRRVWREANPEAAKTPYVPARGRAATAAWRAKYPEKVRAQAATYRARKVAATVENFLPAEIFERDGWLCGLCEKPINPATAYPDPMSVSLDHVLPLSLGGDHSRANAQASHLICNLRKHTKVA